MNDVKRLNERTRANRSQNQGCTYRKECKGESERYDTITPIITLFTFPLRPRLSRRFAKEELSQEACDGYGGQQLDGGLENTTSFPHHRLASESSRSRSMDLVRQKPWVSWLSFELNPKRNKSGRDSGFEACFGLGDNLRSM